MALRAFKIIFLFFAVLIVLSAAYYPAITSRYVYHDDVVYFLTTPTKIEPPGTVFNVAIGRFFGANLFIFLGLLVKNISDLNTIRFLSVVQLSLCGFLFILWTRKYFLSFRDSFFVAIAVFTLPPFQIMVSQAGMGFQPAGVLLAILSAILAFKVPPEGPWLKRFFHKNILFSILLFISAICVYQPSAMFFWSMLGFVLLFSTGSFCQLKNRVFHFNFVAAVAFSVYAAILYQTKKYFASYNLWSYNPYSLTTDYFGKIKWFLGEPLSSVLNLWNVFPRMLIAYFVGIFICGAILLRLLRARKEKDITCARLFFIFIILFLLLFAAFLPNLASENNLFFYRCAPALTALVFFFVIASFGEYIKFFKTTTAPIIFSFILAILACSGVAWANQTIYHHRVLPSQRELKLFTDSIKKYNINNCRRIYVIEPQEDRLRHRGDEYRNLTTRYSHNMPGLLSCVLRDIAKDKVTIFHIEEDPRSKKVTFVFQDLKKRGLFYTYEVIIESGLPLNSFEQGTLVIDMRALHDF